MWPSKPAWRFFPQFRPQEQINEFDPQIGWSKKPNFSTDRKTSEFDITFEINSLGLRDDPMESPAKEPNTYRVMALGDSFVLGFTVDREDLFVDKLEDWWVAENRRVDVINAGTEGYSTDQEVAWFQEQGKAFDPDLVLIFPYENDIYWNGQRNYTSYPKVRYEPDGSRETATLSDPGTSSALSNWATGKVIQMVAGMLGSRSPVATVDLPGGSGKLYAEFAPLLVEAPDLVADCLARTKGALTALRDECASMGADLVMIPIPSESVIHSSQRENFAKQSGLSQISDEAWDPNLPVEHFLRMAEELDITALDPRAHLLSAADGSEKDLYFEEEWHFNPTGNDAFATFVHDELDRIGIFPDAHGATKEASLPKSEEQEGGLPTWVLVYGTLVLILGTCFKGTYQDEPLPLAYLKVAGLLALIFTLVLGGGALLGSLTPTMAQVLGFLFVLTILGFVIYKLGRRTGTILELLRSFTLRGHWYLMPLVVVLLSIGSLLVVAASSPLVAPFIYTLF